MTGLKTNEREGSRATLKYFHMSASKMRVVLDLIRGEDVETAREILANTSREAAEVANKLLASAVANAINNDHQQMSELYVSAAYADEGPTFKRFTPRARGRAGRIRKRTCHVTIIVSRMDEDRVQVVRAARAAQSAASRERRVASSRRRADQQASLNRREAAAVVAAEEAAAAEALAASEDETELDEATDVADETEIAEMAEGAAGDPDTEAADAAAGTEED